MTWDGENVCLAHSSLLLLEIFSNLKVTKMQCNYFQNGGCSNGNLKVK